jgi:hypothetical protein
MKRTLSYHVDKSPHLDRNTLTIKEKPGSGASRIFLEKLFNEVPDGEYVVKYTIAPKHGEYELKATSVSGNYLIMYNKKGEFYPLCIFPKEWEGMRVNRKVVSNGTQGE